MIVLGDDDLRILAEHLAPLIAERIGPAPPGDAPALLTPQAAAARAGVHVETIRRAYRSGALPCARAGNAVRIDAADLDAWLAAPRNVRAPHPRRNGSPMRDAMAAVRSAAE